MSDIRDHPPDCICRACEDLFDQMADAQIDVCTNCGGYFEPWPGQKSQRCGRCRVGLNDPPRQA